MESTIICRACLNEISRQYISLDTPLNDTTVLEVFNYCTKLKANLDDDLPTSLCIPCGRSLQAAYDFIKTTQETDQILRNTIVQSGKEDISHQEDDSNKIVQDDVKEIQYDSDKEYHVEYIEDIDNIEIKQEDEESLFEVLSPKEEIDVELIDEDEQSYIESMADDEIPEKGVKSQECEITNEADSYCNRSEISYIHDGFIEDFDDIPYQNDNKKEIIEVKQLIKENRLYKCDTCDRLFKNMLARNRHEFLEHKENDSQLRKCKDCNFSTTSLSSWQTHRYRHENPTQKKYLCSYCPKKFANPKSLLMHEDYRHGNKERAAKCEKCGKKFMNKQKLDYHILSAHSNGRNYQCPECEKTFKNSFQLRAHKKLHTERTIECPECDKKFLRNVDLRVHMRIHTGELPYQCHLCDKSYRIKVRLTYHMQKHLGTKHICELCSSEFNSKPKLRLHMFEHIGMPFVCDYCDMGFKMRLALSRHTKAIHNIIMTDEELLQNRLKNEKNMKKGIVSDRALLDHSKAELEV